MRRNDGERLAARSAALRHRGANARRAAVAACEVAAAVGEAAAEAHAAAVAVQADVLAHHGEAPTRPIRVVVVDDLPPRRRLLVRPLTGAGHTVVGEAGSAAAALGLVAALARRGRTPGAGTPETKDLPTPEHITTSPPHGPALERLNGPA